jgi:hypothetical protein
MKRYVEAAEIFVLLLTEICSEQTHRWIRRRFGNLIVKRFKILLQTLEHGRWMLDVKYAWAVPPSTGKTDNVD